MLYPANMQTHGPSRSMEDYLDYLYAELEAAADGSARARDMEVRIRAIEEEIDARAAL